MTTKTKRTKWTRPEQAAACQWDGVLAGAYTAASYERSARAHAFFVDAKGREIGDHTACGRLHLDKLAGGADVSGEERCALCEKRVGDLPIA